MLGDLILLDQITQHILRLQALLQTLDLSATVYEFPTWTVEDIGQEPQAIAVTPVHGQRAVELAMLHMRHFQQLMGTSPAIKEHRIFCEMKWADSFYFPQFVELIQTVPIHVTVLANPGDEKTCLSGILDLADKPDDVYLVFFTLTKTNSREVNMLIESVYCVNKATHHKAQKLLTNGGDVKPFIVALKNVMEGRKPMEGLKQSS